ncbi:MAG: tRNA pseudouridine(38-40) synthase TruA [Acidimicrobiales bacterium]
MSSSDQPVAATQRWRLDIAYDGNAFSGFAYQPQFTTVVGVLRETLASTLRMDEPLIVGAGRTDAGVHAFAQVVHVDLPTILFSKNRGPDPERLMLSLNKQLRGRIQVLNAQVVDEEFSARFSAQWRTYRYLVLEATPPGLELTNAWAWTVQGPLDIEAMNRVSEDILGTHDFRAFCRRPTNATADEPLLRRVIDARWERIEDSWTLTPAQSPALKFTIRAQSFCHNMVRCLTSLMVEIGQGRWPENTVSDRLETLLRDHLPSPAPAEGLTLIGVGYEEFNGGPSGRVS